MAGLRAWWSGLARRDQLALALGVGALAVLLFYALVWDPVRAEQQRLREALPGLRAEAARFDAQAAEVRQLRRGSGPQANDGAAPAGLESVAERFGIRASIKSVEESASGRVQVVMDALPYDALLRWIAELSSSGGLAVESIQVRRGAAPGMVIVPGLVLRRTGGGGT